MIDLLLARTAEIDRLSEQLAELQARNADLERELRELGEQAGKSSRHSSKPALERLHTTVSWPLCPMCSGAS